MRVGNKVKVRDNRVVEIYKKNPDLARFLKNKVGIITGFDDIIWYFSVKFEDDDKEYSFRKWELEEIED